MRAGLISLFPQGEAINRAFSTLKARREIFAVLWRGNVWLPAIGLLVVLFGLTSTDILGGRNPFVSGLIVIGDEGGRLIQLGSNPNPAAPVIIPQPVGTPEGDAGESIKIPYSGEAKKGQIDLDGNGQTQGQPVLNQPERIFQPEEIRIPVITLDAPVERVKSDLVELDNVVFQQWLAPDRYAAGWHDTSATLGIVGNTVINGHNNIYGNVFSRLAEVNIGDTVILVSEDRAFTYEVTNKMILPEKFESLDTRKANAQWLLPSDDERLTLVTCWPIESNTHRLIIVAKPISQSVVKMGVN